MGRNCSPQVQLQEPNAFAKSLTLVFGQLKLQNAKNDLATSASVETGIVLSDLLLVFKEHCSLLFYDRLIIFSLLLCLKQFQVGAFGKLARLTVEN